ncbi:MAG: CDGSH iron-sulfur domain-containing protein [Burkholderiales bacterium]|nr:CDGSH iron-sulfur domain-containing protein [Burkholderiales bacterium]MDE2398066.1 CDGSH iron-sulfur domain-containing protein [Burkholderiales bacterium]MDE2453799.1 CDGSH iron-sulfur domain-containing protein [Burkholderiales bacterium]
MSTPVRASDTPFAVDVQAGKDYYWCACGLSKSQPFCDGSHKATDITPMKYTATADSKVYFCGCKASANKPLCDGTHKKPV